MKRLLLAAALIALSFSAHASTTIDQMTTGSSNLIGTEELPFLYPGNTTSFKTTASQIANLESANLPWFSFTGLNCDAISMQSSVVTTAGSPNVSLSSTTTSPIFFTGAKQGDTIVLSWPAQLNTSSAPSFSQTTTVLSATSTALVLSTTAAHTATSYQWASADIYGTDNYNALQNGLTAAYNAYPNGAWLVLPNGMCATHGPVLYYPFQKITGGGWNSGFMLTTSSNSDVLQSYNFWSNIGQEFGDGNGANIFEDFAIEGNKGANTGAGTGSAVSAVATYGVGIRHYGYNTYFNRLYVGNMASSGIQTVWNAQPGDPPGWNHAVTLNSYLENLTVYNNNGYGIDYAGSHDGYVENTTLVGNATGGIIQNQSISQASGSPLNMNNNHTYQNGGFDLDCSDFCLLQDNDLEGASLLRNGGQGLWVRGGGFGSLALGSSTTGSAAFNIRMDQANVGTLINNAGSGFNDTWYGGTVTSVAGTAYNPSTAIGTIGIPNNFGATNGQPLIFKFSSSWPVGLVTNANSVFSLSDGVNIGTAGLGFTLGSNRHVGLGPNSVTASAAGESPDGVGIYGGTLGFETTGSTLPTNGLAYPLANQLELVTSGAASIEANAIGHVIVAGSTPSAGAGCGTSPTPSGTDNAGAVIMGTSPTGSCPVTFANAWTNAPDGCDCTDNTTSSQGCRALSISTTSFALVATTTPWAAADSVSYRCHSHRF